MKTVPVESGGRILVIGCGLIGTSFAKAVKAERPKALIHGVEPNASYREFLYQEGVFDVLYDSFQPLVDESNDQTSIKFDAQHISASQTGPGSFRYDLAVLATPISVACHLLPDVAKLARTVTDVCSIKEPICNVAADVQLGNRFAPSHPMAGLATGGPQFANELLFRNQPWILIDGWPASASVIPWIELCGARVTYLRSAQLHDSVMAGVSHGVHLMSLCTMLATQRACREEAFPEVTGPGFRDVTRLAASPEGFWVDTLLRNREPVVDYLHHAISFLRDFTTTLEQGDADMLAALLRDARSAKSKWTKTT